jgi:hypothetical protein
MLVKERLKTEMGLFPGGSAVPTASASTCATWPSCSGCSSGCTEPYRLGANIYIVKPLDFAKFTEAVRQMGLSWLLLNQPRPG